MRVPSALSFLAGLVSFLACGSSSPADEEDEPVVQRMVAFDHAPFDAILRATVRDERVDYAAVRAEHIGALRDYLDRLAAFDPQLVPPRDRLALYVNLYNATMIAEVVERLATDEAWTAAADEFAVFGQPLVRIGGGRMSLNELENDVVRKEFDDPRIHVALVCGAVSCPPLLQRAYVPADLDETLEENMRRFLTDGRRNRIDREAKRLELSKIFEWYADDFGGAEKVAEYVDRWVEGDVGRFEVGFMEYDWSLNAAPSGSDRTPEKDD